MGDLMVDLMVDLMSGPDGALASGFDGGLDG